MTHLLVGTARFAVLLTAVLAASLPLGAEDKPHTPPRARIHDPRPEEATGWVVIDKSAFWPLCYEALDQIEVVRSLAGSDDKEPLADAIEKCGAWLNLAASAAMTRGEAGVVDVAEECVRVADRIRDNKVTVAPERIQKLMTLSLLCMAKSHLIRAEDAEQSAPTPDATPRSKQPSTPELREAEREITEARREAAAAKYVYDTEQLRRHVFVSQDYLEAAAKTGDIEVDAKLLNRDFTRTPLTAESTFDSAQELTFEIRVLLTRLFMSIDERRVKLATELGIDTE
ncbi:hypothetical protein FHS27_004823 [Rhodopirellula rubra]|uniref:Secreted protein n=1 Tax=Aporhodopirellula rubra TaxID=980271 RepID=A0A7W5H819_9BACT|nr:hypothetical protein [Aporhodopirellula rubra]MBB3208989.1 hypothetical protein [Aporhodopirellula rubra]